MPSRVDIIITAIIAVSSASRAATAVECLPGIVDEVVVEGLSGATAMTVAPDGRIFICEQEGMLRVVRGGKLLDEPFLSLPVDSFWERGLIGVVLDPRFPEVPHVYVVYVSPDPYPHHRVSRFTAAGDRAAEESELVLLAGDDQRTLGGSMPAGHQGGAIRFGIDGRLYIGIGEQTAGDPSQELDTLQGKILRVGADGSIPEDNPFLGATRGKYRAIWARGLRNPFGIAVDRITGKLFINDVGGAAWEEINEGAAGANYGWPKAEGPSAHADLRGPLHAYERSVGKSITGGVFYRPATRQFPPEYEGQYFFADFEAGWIRVLDPGQPSATRVFARGLARPVDLAVAPDGSLLSLERNAWVKDGEFRGGTGILRRFRSAASRTEPVRATGARTLSGLEISERPDELPRLLSSTGIFRSIATLETVPGIVPYDVNSPLWSDGASKRRWIALPARAKIGFRAEGEWTIPRGTVLVKHFDSLPEGRVGRSRRLETRVLYVGGENGGHGATYRWRPDDSDAELLDGSAIDPPDASRSGAASWYYPSRKDCLTCHTEAAGFVLGIKTKQLNRTFDYGSGPEDQLRAWSRLGMLEPAPREEDLRSLGRFAALSDSSATLEERVRSYLDSNCSNCHRPGGSRGLLDLRHETPLEKQGLVGAPLLAGDLGVPGALCVMPGDAARSGLYLRMARLDVFKMPPLAMNKVDREALAVIGGWIEELGKGGGR